MMEGLCFFFFFKYRVTKGFKFHARPQTGAYSCCLFTNQGSVRVDSKAQLAYPGGYLLAEMGGGGLLH